MKIAIITGDYPHIRSGVGDYSYRLATELRTKINVSIITSKDKGIVDENNIIKIDWKVKEFFGLLRFLKREQIGLVNIQYPTLLYGKFNLVPHLYCILLRLLGIKVITTLHEYSNIHWLRSLSELIFVLFSHKVVVTTHFERQALLSHLRLLITSEKIRVIHVGTSIDVCNTKPNLDSSVVTFFGLFYPNKGSEAAVNLMAAIQKGVRKQLVFRFIGGTHAYYKDYFANFKKFTNERLANTQWVVDSALDEICNHIKDSFVSVLWYKDGASLRRTSLLAMIANGIPVITNRGIFSDDLAPVEDRGVFYCETEREAVPIFENLATDEDFYSSCHNHLLEFSREFRFEKIADQYQELFRKVA
jgi:glycosyltransferase involved in cell wall biosynthesis